MMYSLFCGDMRSVIENNIAGKTAEKRLHFCNPVRIHKEADRPPQWRNALRKHADFIGLGRTASAAEVEADSAHTQIIHPVKFFICDGAVDNRNRPCMFWDGVFRPVQ